MDINAQNKEKYLEDLKIGFASSKAPRLKKWARFSASACRNTKHA